MTEREAFEAWMRDTHGPGVNLVRSDDGYISTVPHRAVRMTYASVQMLWEGWQAARAQPAQAGQWLPIETAPKDGTPILLARDHRVTAGHWEPERYPTATEYHSTTGEYLGQFETGEVIDAWWYSEDGGFDEENHPTHWMPLPPPPSIVAL